MAVPAAIGSVPLAALMTVHPPPYPAWDSAGWLLILILPVSGIAAGCLSRRLGALFFAIAVSFWVAQSFATWFGTCTDISSAASCGPSGGISALAFAAILSAVLGVIPLAVAYAFLRPPVPTAS